MRTASSMHHVEHNGIVAPAEHSSSPALDNVVELLSATDSPVLLIGEDGTGKDFFAERIHQVSRLACFPFVKVDCASARKEVLSGYLHHAANSGANGARIGTLFFEDVAELDGPAQARLLAALVERSAAGECNGRARLICATRHNLEQRSADGHFSEELAYRISAVCLRVPPLRHRRQEIPALFNHFVSKLCDEHARPRPLVSERLLQGLMSYAWPGNLRELERVAQQLVLFGDVPSTTLDARERPATDSPTKDGSQVSLKDAAREASRRAERVLILETLARTGWNRKRAAQELKISYKALLYKLKDISLEESARQG